MVVHLQFTTPDDPLPEESFSTLEEEDLEENAMAPNTRMDREQDVEMVENQVNEWERRIEIVDLSLYSFVGLMEVFTVEGSFFLLQRSDVIWVRA